MSAPKEMNLQTRRVYLAIRQKQYRLASPAERSHLLDEMTQVTGLNRKYLISLMSQELTLKPRTHQRGPTYGPEVEAVVLCVAESLDFLCGKRLQPALLDTADLLAQQGELTLTPDLRAALARISPATLDRLYQRQPELPRRRLTRALPRKASGISRLVPMQVIPWDIREPGHLEIDLVQHSGPDTSGDFLYTLHWMDVATGWSERYPILGRSGMVMHDACAVLWQRLPFPLREIHIDNGSEFLNDHLLRFFQKQDPTVCFSRNRPWRKNDSRFVEQKNSTLVRAYLHDGRMDSLAHVWMLDALYERMRLYYNLFQPVMRMIEKERIEEAGGRVRYRRRYDTPATSFERLRACQILSPETEVEWQRLRHSLNLRLLREEIYALIAQAEALPNRAPGEAVDVYRSLSQFRPSGQKGVGGLG